MLFRARIRPLVLISCIRSNRAVISSFYVPFPVNPIPRCTTFVVLLASWLVLGLANQGLGQDAVPVGIAPSTNPALTQREVSALQGSGTTPSAGIVTGQE